MNNIDIANGIVFQKMEISKESFEDRLICQKRYIFCSLQEQIWDTHIIGMCVDHIPLP